MAGRLKLGKVVPRVRAVSVNRDRESRGESALASCLAVFETRFSALQRGSGERRVASRYVTIVTESHAATLI